MVLSSASRYRSIKYSWQNRHAPFLRPSIVEACNTKYRTITSCFGEIIDAAGTYSQWGFNVLYLYLFNSITAHSSDYFCTFSDFLDTEVGSGDTLTYCSLIN
jgi:hypothetical protein